MEKSMVYIIFLYTTFHGILNFNSQENIFCLRKVMQHYNKLVLTTFHETSDQNDIFKHKNVIKLIYIIM